MQALYTMAGYLSGWIAVTGWRMGASRFERQPQDGKNATIVVENSKVVWRMPARQVPQHEFASMISEVTD
jgi:hypothetical protein